MSAASESRAARVAIMADEIEVLEFGTNQPLPQRPFLVGSGYRSPYGKLPGLAQRLAEHIRTLSTDKYAPFVGLGMIEDLRMVSRFLNLREFAEDRRINGTDDEREFADEILRNEETLQAIENALQHAGFGNYDPVAAVETMDRETRNDAFAKVRGLLVEKGALAPDDDQTDPVDLLRVLLA